MALSPSCDLPPAPWEQEWGHVRACDGRMGERSAAASAQRNRGSGATAWDRRQRQNSLRPGWLRGGVGRGGHAGAPILKCGWSVLQTPCEVHVPARRTGAICPRCGCPILPTDATDTMLATLARLARFGLDAEGRPLLNRPAEER